MIYLGTIMRKQKQNVHYQPFVKENELGQSDTVRYLNRTSGYSQCNIEAEIKNAVPWIPYLSECKKIIRRTLLKRKSE